MRSSIVAARTALVLLLALAAAPRDAAATWAMYGVPVTPPAYRLNGYSIAPDGAGGFFVHWTVTPSNLSDPTAYVLRVGTDAQPSPGWSASGAIVDGARAYGTDAYCSVTADGLGGALLATVWNQHGPNWMLRRVTANGNVSGILVSSSSSSEIAAVPDGSGYYALVVNVSNSETVVLTHDGSSTTIGTSTSYLRPGLASDGTGGAFAAWECHCQHMAGLGSIADVVLPNCSYEPRLASDGTGGTFALWAGNTGGLRLIRMDGDLAVVPAWDPGGVLVTPDAGSPAYVLPDGVGGVFVVWGYLRVTAQHYTAAGARAAGWPAAGMRLSADSIVTSISAPVADGSGGFYVAWSRSYGDIVAQHVLGGGSIAAGWGAQGSPIAKVGATPVSASDGAGGAYFAWVSKSNTIDAQHVAAGDVIPLAVPGPGIPRAFALRVANPVAGARWSGEWDSPLTGVARWTLLDVAGRAVDAGDLGASGPGVHAIGGSTAGLRAGVYLLRVEHAGGTATARLVVAR